MQSIFTLYSTVTRGIPKWKCQMKCQLLKSGNKSGSERFGTLSYNGGHGIDLENHTISPGKPHSYFSVLHTILWTFAGKDEKLIGHGVMLSSRFFTF